MKTCTKLVCTCATIASLVVPTSAGNWPSWRGPSGSGISEEKNLPVSWSEKENVRWRVELPERGNSSPIVWGDKVFVTQALSDSKRRTVMCFDRASGKLLWQSGPTYAENEATQRENPYCSATPVTDGERVIASFGSAGLYSFDLAGKELWHREFGKLEHMFGNAASPMLVGDLCVLNFGPGENARLIAVKKQTGENVWEAQPPKVEGGDEQPGGPQRGGGGRFGGPGGGGGPGQMVASQMISQGDKSGDQKLSAEEFTALANKWFGALDREQKSKLDQREFAERVGEILGGPSGAPPAANADRGEQRRGGGPGGGGAGRFIGPGLFSATDTNNDGTLSQEEWVAAFGKWFAEWDKNKVGALGEETIRDGLNTALPRPQFGGLGGGGPGGPGGGGGRGRGGPGGGGGSWSTPVLISAGGRDELVVALPGSLVSFDPATGKQLWMSKGIGNTIYSSPVLGEGTLVAMNSGPGGGSAIAVKPGGSGDVTESQRMWRQERFKSGIGSGVIHEGHLYTISQDGIAACNELKTGNTVWEERLKGAGSRGSSWSSILLAEGRLYIPNQSGDVFVLRAAPKFEVLATNSVKESTNASLAAADGELFLRTEKALWCFAAGKKP